MSTALKGRTHGRTDQRCKREKSSCQPGAVHTWPLATSRSACPMSAFGGCNKPVAPGIRPPTPESGHFVLSRPRSMSPSGPEVRDFGPSSELDPAQGRAAKRRAILFLNAGFLPHPVARASPHSDLAPGGVSGTVSPGADLLDGGKRCHTPVQCILSSYLRWNSLG